MYQSFSFFLSFPQTISRRHAASGRASRFLIVALLSFLFSLGLSNPDPLLAQSGSRQLYLPILAGPPVVSAVLFNSSEDCGNENFTELVRSPASYSAGIEQLGWGILVRGGVGYAYRVEWLIDGAVVPGLSESGFVDEDLDIVSGTLYFGSGECGGELPRGQYLVRVYLNEVLQSEGLATIQ